MHGFGRPEDIEIWNTKRWRNGNYAQLEMLGRADGAQAFRHDVDAEGLASAGDGDGRRVGYGQGVEGTLLRLALDAPQGATRSPTRPAPFSAQLSRDISDPVDGLDLGPSQAR